MEPEKFKDPVLPVMIVIVLVAAVAGAYYYWFKHDQPAPQPQIAPVADAPAPEPKREPEILHPVPGASDETKHLPPLAESDQPMREAAVGLSGKELEKYFFLDNVVRRFVVTVDSLPRKKLSQRYNLAKPVADKFPVTGKDEELTLNPKNYQRYTPYVRLAETVDTTKLVSLYIYFYPLFQEEYKNLGYPKKYFNDRLVEAIDHLLATPEVKGPVKLVQPKVYYHYADANLENLSAGQKTLIRMGPENAARIKAKLQEVKTVLLRAG